MLVVLILLLVVLIFYCFIILLFLLLVVLIFIVLIAVISALISHRKVIVVPVVIGALEAVSVNFREYMNKTGVNVRLEVLQKTALLGTAKILRKMQSLQDKRDMGPMVTCCNPLPRTINQTEDHA